MKKFKLAENIKIPGVNVNFVLRKEAAYAL